MNVRALVLTLSTTALTALIGCATTQTGSREDTAATNTSTQKKECGCAHKAQEASAQAMAEGKDTGCGCPHCAGASKAGASEATACGCSHQDKGQGGSAQASDSQG